uniref:diacylglycerol O-acyltransferase n=1 Tax=Ascaris lumbricoides TaxID=6252 RepID=A0A0M3IX73_ASCLU
MFWLPIRREQVLYMTDVILAELIAVDRESILHCLNRSPRGRAVGIVVGGAEELLESHPSTYRLCLANRKGFIRIAIESGFVELFNLL